MNRNTKYDDIFIDIDENMTIDTFYSSDEVAEKFFHLTPALKGKNKNARSVYIQKRNEYKKRINVRAFQHRKGWMLFIAKQGTHIVKTSNKELMEKMIDFRMQKFFNALQTMITNGNWILENTYIESSKKQVFKPFINGAYGLATIMVGQIQSSKMPKVEKESLIKRATYFINEDKPTEK